MLENNTEENVISYEYYKNDISSYRQKFFDVYKCINTLLVLLENNREISQDTKIEARIKSYKSFINNINKRKNVDDCFGIRIISEKEDFEKIQTIVKEIFEVKNIKDHTKNMNTAYNAIHYNVVPMGQKVLDELAPTLELQFCTFEQDKCNNEGFQAHDIYKLPNHKNITFKQAQKEVFYELRRVMSLEKEKLEEELPEFYKINKENKIEKLNRSDTIRKLFPTILNDKGKVSKDNEILEQNYEK